MKPSSTKPFLSRYRWIILAVVWICYVAFGLNMKAIAPLVTPILTDLNMSNSEMGFVLGSWQLVYIPVSIIAGIVIDRWGIRRSLFIGTLVMALSAGLRYFATGFGTLLPVVALFGIGGPLISIGAPKAISVWFKDKARGVAVGIYTTAPWTGALFATAATNSLVMPLTDYSWRLTFVCYGIFTLVLAVIWFLFARDVRESDESAKISIREVFIRLVTIRNVRILLLAGLLTLLMDHGFSHWLPRMLETRGYTPETAGFMASIPLVTAIPSVLLVPGFTPRHLRGRCLALLGLLTATSYSIIHFTSSWMLIGGLILCGITLPSLLPMLMLIMMDEPGVGPENMGLASGVFFCIAQIGGFTGPLLMGAMVDITGSFLSGVMFLTGIGVILCAAAFFLKESRADQILSSQR
ncbi:CynX/NimT family MFS transporter [Chloroflexota bacterium]